MGGALGQRVEDVDHEGSDHHPEEPAPARQEIFLEVTMVAEVAREQKRADQVNQKRIAEDEGIELEGPGLDQPQSEFKPPPEYAHQAEVGDPEKMHPPDARSP